MIRRTIFMAKKQPLPVQTEPHCAYVLRNPDGTWKTIEFACPCGNPGCWERVLIDRLWCQKKGFPYWTLTVNQLGQPTLSPSVSHHRGCKVHYSLVAGEFTLYPFNS